MKVLSFLKNNFTEKRLMVNKIITATFWAFIISCLNVSAQNKYYLSASGNDSNNGHSRIMAWRSVRKINETNFKPGDSVFFEGGITFKGNIKLTSDDSGSGEHPVVFTSYGKAKTCINAGDGEGVLAINASFVKLIRLNFIGSGTTTNHGSGIHFYADDSLKAPSHIEIIGCEVKGFNTYGIAFGVNNSMSCRGYQYVHITGCNASENGQAGIASYGSQHGFQHSNFRVAYCKAFDNRGILSKTENHSGNGIDMGMVDSLIIEHCEAFENGADNRCNAGGPVGIWVWMCKNALIQHCISHNNHAGGTKDGGGFDIDGGSSNCVMQYNYSYNNEGAGYLLAEYGALFHFTNNIVRFNISVNDGRKNNYGGIAVWGASSDYSVTNSTIYNNTICTDDSLLINGTPAAITLMGTNFKNVLIANNIFVTKGNAHFINADTLISKSAAQLLHNDYYSYDSRYIFDYGHQKFQSIRTWLGNNPDQEISRGVSALININPLFTHDPFDRRQRKDLSVQKKSPVRNKSFIIPSYSNRKVFPGAIQ